jgi:putative ABC transport system substrate-binding protein
MIVGVERCSRHDPAVTHELANGRNPPNSVARQRHLECPVAAFRDGLRALEWTDDSITVLDRWAEEQGEQLPSIASDLIGSGPGILVTIGNSATLAAARATKSLAIIFVGFGNPRARSLVDDLAHPGGNATGLSRNSSSLIGERFRLLRELSPASDALR